ncbi:anhydro-N-acetylmuramic acid kinase [Spirochaetia bacterium]|nr:anhydro-N-acetylmuramic acid kinase [Spirochaetia bacterium]
MEKLRRIREKKKLLGIGLMSGTSLDGMDAALVEIEGCGKDTKVKLRGFYTQPYSKELRALLLDAVMGETGGSRTLCCLNTLIGKMALDAALMVCEKAGVSPAEVDFAGSHGQTIYHQAREIPFGGTGVRGTLQIGEAAIIAEGLGCVVVSDFRVRDMAAGGQGAPLVPYTEYLLYGRKDETTALQNIGGIGNITILPAGSSLDQVLAFDTGPGNMIIDAVISALSGGTQTYDAAGAMAGRGKVSGELLDYMREKDGDYLQMPPPKSTGRESYNADYIRLLLEKAKILGLSPEDTLASVTCYTADTIRIALERFCPELPQRLIIGGGGAHNETLLRYIRQQLADHGSGGCAVVSADEMGINADAKEAVAFAVLANETLHGICNNAPSATGASHPVIMGKISF